LRKTERGREGGRDNSLSLLCRRLFRSHFKDLQIKYLLAFLREKLCYVHATVSLTNDGDPREVSIIRCQAYSTEKRHLYQHTSSQYETVELKTAVSVPLHTASYKSRLRMNNQALLLTNRADLKRRGLASYLCCF
jgi:hypothetical protein